MTAEFEHLRIVEALLFAAREPVDIASLAARLPADTDIDTILSHLQDDYATRGVNLVRVADKWLFRTAPDLAGRLTHAAEDQRKLSRAALESLAIIAYHQPVTRAEIEAIRGVSTSRGTLDVLLEVGWIRLRGRRRTPGRPVTFGTTDGFLAHFGLEAIQDLPGLEDLKGAGLLDGQIPPGFHIPMPNDDSALTPGEDPLDDAPELMDLASNEEE
jgi:segregation and condensation protein B